MTPMSTVNGGRQGDASWTRSISCHAHMPLCLALPCLAVAHAAAAANIASSRSSLAVIAGAGRGCRCLCRAVWLQKPVLFFLPSHDFSASSFHPPTRLRTLSSNGRHGHGMASEMKRKRERKKALFLEEDGGYVTATRGE